MTSFKRRPRSRLTYVPENHSRVDEDEGNRLIRRNGYLNGYLFWGRLVTCGGLVIRLVLIPELFTDRLPIGRRLPTCPTTVLIFSARAA